MHRFIAHLDKQVIIKAQFIWWLNVRWHSHIYAHLNSTCLGFSSKSKGSFSSWRRIESLQFSNCSWMRVKVDLRHTPEWSCDRCVVVWQKVLCTHELNCQVNDVTCQSAVCADRSQDCHQGISCVMRLNLYNSTVKMQKKRFQCKLPDSLGTFDGWETMDSSIICDVSK